MKRAPKLDVAHGPIVAALEAAGAFVQSMAGLGGGAPDILVCYRGKWTVAEIKSHPATQKAGRPNELQMTWWRRAGTPPVVWRTVEEALKGVGAL